MKKLVLLSAGILALVLPNASAQYATNVLFTTYGDFGGASAGSANETVTAVNTWSADANNINGLAYNNPGVAGTSGSLRIQNTYASGTDWVVASLANNIWQQPFISALDPGGTAAWQPPSYPNGTTVAYSGIMQMTYSIPDNNGGSFFQLGVLLQYAANGYYGAFFPSSTTDLGFTDPNGYEVYQATIPYTITAGVESLGGLGIGILYNSDFSPLDPWYVDQIQTLTAVPEPSTMALVGLGAFGFAFFARRRRA